MLLQSPTESTAFAKHRTNGFTLIEILIVVAIVGILASIALPSYTSYVRRGQMTEGFSALSQMQQGMERWFQDRNTYLDGSKCGVATPSDTTNFTFTCTASASDFTVTATGRANLAGYTYTVDSNGQKKTTSFAGSNPNKNCWLSKPNDC
jgi:type IV pilus assembly protein PilE